MSWGYIRTSYVEDRAKSPDRNTRLKKRSLPQGLRPNQERRSNYSVSNVQDLSFEKTAMGNISLKNIGENSSSRTNYSPSNIVSHRQKLRNFEYGVGSPEPKFAGKSSHHSPSVVKNNNFENRRNSSDSGYNSSGKLCEPPTETNLSNGLQRVGLSNYNKSCGKSDYSQSKSGTTDIKLPCCSKTTPSSGRSSSNNPKPRSYDRLTSPKSVSSVAFYCSFN